MSPWLGWAGLGWAGWAGVEGDDHNYPLFTIETSDCRLSGLGWAGPRTWESCSSLITRGVTTSPDSPAQPSPVKWWLFNNMLKSNSDLIVSCNQIFPRPQLPHHNCNEKDYNCDFPHCSAPWERPLLLRLTQLGLGDVGCWLYERSLCCIEMYWLWEQLPGCLGSPRQLSAKQMLTTWWLSHPLENTNHQNNNTQTRQFENLGLFLWETLIFPTQSSKSEISIVSPTRF